jgi:hypothetical protein
MASSSFYFQIIRKITAAFASLFNNIMLIRFDENNNQTQRIIVPIVYGDKEKYIKRLEGDPGSIPGDGTKLESKIYQNFF